MIAAIVIGAIVAALFLVLILNTLCALGQQSRGR